MFGRKKIDGEATVMAATPVSGGSFEFVVDVRPAQGAPFRTTVRQVARDIVHPEPGDIVRVSIDPKKHEVELEIGDDPRYAVQDKAVGRAFIQRMSICSEEAEQLRLHGTAATAVVESVTVTEVLQMDRSREFALRATVQPPDGDPFDAAFPLFLFGAAAASPAVGETINVSIDPANRSIVRAPIMWRQSAASQVAAVRWQVPAECPECGARVDQSAAETAAHPTCEYCHAPLPCTPLAPA